MARKINSQPKGYHTATPVLVVKNATAAIDYYTSVFGAKELSRTLSGDGLTILKAELKIGNSIILINDEMPEYGILSPVSLGGTSTAVQLYLTNVDDVWQRAIDVNVGVILPLEDTFWGERTGKIIDPFGHVWVLSRQTEVLSKEEIEKRAEAFYGTNVAPELGLDTAEVIDIETGYTIETPVADIETVVAADATPEATAL